MSTTILPAVRYVASTAKPALGYIYLQCRIKPGASKQAEGIISISETVIEVSVKPQPEDGKANRALTEVLSSVLKCPKSDVGIIRGLKSRDKTVAISNIDAHGDTANYISRVKERLENALQG